MTKLLLNARFTARPMTGVDRVAMELWREIALLQGELPTGMLGLEVAVPGNGDAARLAGDTRHVTVHRGRLSGHAWEQAELPFMGPDAWLLSLCNTGPVSRRRQAVMIHDAQIRICPQAYSRAFRLLYRVLQPAVARRAALVFTISEFSRRKLEEYGIVPRGRAAILANGCDHIERVAADPDILARAGLQPGGYFLAIGSQAPHKNLARLIDAIGLCEQRMPLVIAGGGNRAVFAEESLAEAPDVIRTGRVSDGELKALYGNACALLFPSLTEGFGLPPLEAMSQGCPVIASTGGAIPDVCGEAALYADPLDSLAWAKAMDLLASDDEARQDLAERGRERAAQFRWRKSAIALVRSVAQAEGNVPLLEALDALRDRTALGG